MTSDNLSALIARLEAATGPDREIDALIVAGLNNALLKPYPPATDFGPQAKWQFWSLDGQHFLGNESKFKVLPFTASIDAARTLVPEGHTWSVGDWTNNGQGPCATVWPHEAERQFYYVGIWKHGTPAIALSIASLRARMTTTAPNRRTHEVRPMKTGDPTTIQTEARALLAAEFERQYASSTAEQIRTGDYGEIGSFAASIRAITTALNLRDEWKLAYDEAEIARVVERDEWNAAEKRASEARSLALEEAARVAVYAVERADRDWGNPVAADTVKEVGREIADAIRALGKDES